MNNLTNTKEWKDWIKNEVKPMLRGLGRMFKLKREIRKKDNETKRKAKRESADKAAASSPSDESTSVGGSPNPPADSLEGSAPLEEPLPVGRPDGTATEVPVDA